MTGGGRSGFERNHRIVLPLPFESRSRNHRNQDGFEGIFDGRLVSIIEKTVIGLHSQAGTFLGTSNKTGTGGREDEFL